LAFFVSIQSENTRHFRRENGEKVHSKDIVNDKLINLDKRRSPPFLNINVYCGENAHNEIEFFDC
jgi:hypothetical protein